MEHISKIFKPPLNQKRIECEYVKMEKRYRNCYSIETESILSETLRFFYCRLAFIQLRTAFLLLLRCFFSGPVLKYSF